MNAESQTTSLEGITYRDDLPIDWEVITVMPSEGEQLRENRDNEALLQNLLLLDDVSQDAEETDKGSAQEHLKRLETKLDLLLNLVTQLMAANLSLPPRRSLILGSRGLCVYTQKDTITTLKSGDLLKIRFYLDTQFPRPLVVCGRLIAVQDDNFTVSYCPFEIRLQDLLDKLVFRRHRRAIALSRRDANT